MPRFNVVILLSLFTMLNLSAVLAFIMAFTRKIFIVNNTVLSVIFAVAILCFNIYMIQYKKRYYKHEAILSKTWVEEKTKNILITISYIIFTFIFIGCSLYYIKGNPINNR